MGMAEDQGVVMTVCAGCVGLGCGLRERGGIAGLSHGRHCRRGITQAASGNFRRDGGA